MKTEVKNLGDIAYEHSMHQYAVNGATKILELIIRDAGSEMLKQEPFNALEGLWCLLNKTNDSMIRTESEFEDLIKLHAEIKLPAEANKHE